MSQRIDSLASREQQSEPNSQKMESLLLPVGFSLTTEMKNKLDKLSQESMKEIVDSITPLID